MFTEEQVRLVEEAMGRRDLVPIEEVARRAERHVVTVRRLLTEIEQEVGELPRGDVCGSGRRIYFTREQADVAVVWLASRTRGRPLIHGRRSRKPKPSPTPTLEVDLARQARDGRPPELAALERFMKLRLQEDPGVSPEVWAAAFEPLVLIRQTDTTSVFTAPPAAAQQARAHQAAHVRACGGAVRIVELEGDRRQ